MWSWIFYTRCRTRVGVRNFSRCHSWLPAEATRLCCLLFTGSDFKAGVQNAFAHVRTVSFFALNTSTYGLEARGISLGCPGVSLSHSVITLAAAGRSHCVGLCSGATPALAAATELHRRRSPPTTIVNVRSRSHRLGLKLYSSWSRPLKIAASNLSTRRRRSTVATQSDCALSSGS